ncbi:uncharacterized protein LOC111339709 [Stylophora pistillata]|uniref:uncharacterized protein LOC111339709 n=1 Tax=Stylophora pistillata TaxID=50429 RepID=UPI000C04A03D|nr:uncharacterized protein LOC111339709 [Stylophora pistillata]
MKEVFVLTTILAVLPTYVSSTIYYVDAGARGMDSNTGQTIDQPFRTIRRCVNALSSPGDECHIRAGRYHEPEFPIAAKKGSASQPIVIQGYGNENPVIDGTIELIPLGSSSWVRGSDGIYSAQIGQDIWQLFVGEEMMTNARWPNALWSDKSVFNNSHWAKSASTSTRGTMIDNGDKDLAGSRFNVTGAMAVLNIGSFNTFTAKVESHVPGRNSFTYDETFGSIKFVPARVQNQYFLEDKREFLDNDGEWFFDRSTRTVYVKTPDGATPAGKIRGKVQTYAFTISNCEHLHFKQLTFFGTTFKTLPTSKRRVIGDLTFHSINFSFPSYSMRMLGVTAPPLWTFIRASRGRRFKLINSTFYGTDGLALQYYGDGVLLENNLFEYNDWSVSLSRTKNGGFGTVISQGPNDQFVSNTLRYNGAAHGFRPNGRNPRVELNHIHHQCWGNLQHDGAGIQFQIPSQTDAMCMNNWVHSSPKPGLRFDAA